MSACRLAVIICFLFSGQAIGAVKTWRLGGILENKKVWLTIADGQIVCIDQQTPSAPMSAPIPEPMTNCVSGFKKSEVDEPLVLDTQSFIFPGLMDLHNHIEFNSLPLWQEARGQFQNRFEWRNTQSYQKGPHKFFMRLMKLPLTDPNFQKFSQFNCLSLQWAELKALVGGVTTIQGLGRYQNADCTKDFAIRNLEIADSMELGSSSISSAMEVLNPQMIEGGFKKYIEPNLNSDRSNYAEVYEEFKKKFQLSQWIFKFQNEEHTVENGLRLTIGPKVEAYIKDLKPNASRAETEIFVQRVLEFEAKNLGLELRQISEAKTQILSWIFDRFDQQLNTSYLEMHSHSVEAQKLASQFLYIDTYKPAESGFDAIIFIPIEARQYFVKYELGVLDGVRNKRSSPQVLALLSHLSEGRRQDFYNSHEFDYAETLGLLSKKFISIHGVGFSEENLKRMAANNFSLVISPFSNLLLYGESVDLKSALQYGVNLALGSDWSITGTKSLLDEARVLKSYATHEKAQLSNKQIVNMMTINPAKALQLVSRGFGQIALGSKADILLISKQADADSSLVQAQNENVEMVVVKGQPLYGNKESLQKYSQYVGENESSVVAIDADFFKDLGGQSDCQALIKSNKAFRLTVRGESFSVHLLQRELKSLFDEATKLYHQTYPSTSAQDLHVDPLFFCQDPLYQKVLSQYVH